MLRDGKKIETKPTSETNKNDLIKSMVGRTLSAVYPARGDTAGDEIILETKNLTGNGVKDISLSIKKGEIFGLGGLVGAGRTEFAQLLYGVKKVESGEILFKGEPITVNHPRQAMRAGITLVPEDRKNQGLILGQAVKNNISIAVLKKLSKSIFLIKDRELKLAERYKESLRIKTPSLAQLARNLSGGNQQKVVVAKGLATEPELIIFDEPTRGIDVGAKQEIYTLINGLVAEGKTIIMITSEMEDLLGMSDRIAVFCEGRVTGILDKTEFDSEAILGYASNTADLEVV